MGIPSVRKSFSKSDIRNACREYGYSVVGLPHVIEPSAVLWGLCGNESSFGYDCTPRHEPIYDVGGKYSTSGPMPELLEKYGSAAAYSYGPMQLMFANAPKLCTPESFNSLDVCFKASIMQLNKFIKRYDPKSLDDIAACWNTGHIPSRPWNPELQKYSAKFIANYNSW